MLILFQGTPYMCEVCSKQYQSLSSLVRHKKTHGEKTHCCQKCDAKFYTANSLKEHLSTHEQEKSFMCDLCGVDFKHKTSLQRHRRMHKEDQASMCLVCGKSFTRKDSLVKHLQSHAGPRQCDVCYKKVIHMEQHKKLCMKERDAPVPCPLCGKKFKERKYMLAHQKGAHIQPKQFACQKCHKLFNFKATCLAHERSCQF